MARSRVRTRREKRADPGPDSGDAEIKKKIVRRGAKYCVTSEDGSREFGCFDSKAEAQRRLGQVESFKQGGHFHVFGGAESSRDEGAAHTHRVDIGEGVVVVSTPSDPGPEHTHEIAIGSVTIRSGPPLVDENGLAKGLLPRTLSWTAVALGEMPTFGQSGIAKSLEADVPARFRYWTAKTAETARTVRDALVEAQLFTPESVQKVDGESRRVVVETTTYLANEDAAAAELQPATSVEMAGASLVTADADVTIVAADLVDALDPTRVDDLLQKSEPWVAVVNVQSDRLPTVRASARKIFRLRTRPGVVFATSQEKLEPSALIADEEHSLDDDVSKALRGDMTILIAKVDDETTEERFVLGIVLEPDVVDSQKDTYDVATVRATAHKYMRDFQNVGLMHKGLINGKAHVVQSFIAPVAMEIAGTTIKIGTWLVGMIFDDEPIWAEIKSGNLTSFSIGGDAVRQPVDAKAT